ncbi:glycogen synthase [Nonlabens arenilitoris]|uniref:Glycogen synthase n=1 Tax=Nonlabens arenilitoris TaxID=1217969 RepID=A0A2S7UBT9_9FLAO|nr:glycogen/starch synthase [Nonlabens arenilitoris]PQJ32061.1 glycogen synthase [Nonlabens arenilitoris]
MRILHISAECYPVAKVGGLADVVGALPKYLNNSGQQCSVIMPFYDVRFTQNHQFETIYEDTVFVAADNFHFKILKLADLSKDFELFLVDIPQLLYKDYVYSHDDAQRFTAFQIAVLQWIQTHQHKPDVIHCHDHHTGLVPFMMQYCYRFENLKNIPSVLTIHNAQYQGWFSHDRIAMIPDFDKQHVGLLDWDGSINPLATAIKCAWKVNTVSPSYMVELQQKANGLEALLSHESAKCLGILNGIDTTVWNPTTDAFIKKQYSSSSHISGKKVNKKWLCDTYGLDFNKPLFVFIGRLVYEKGSDLFPQVFKEILQENDVSILLLGSGDSDTENKLIALREKFKGHFNAYIGYDEELSHLIYAGADFLLMPSRVEPCGLNQMYSLTYGTIPIVRSIGGLKDTIVDVDNDGYGFVHEDTSVGQIKNAMQRAAAFYDNTLKFKKIRTRIMKIDHSWDNSAQQYISLYNTLKN